jgi:hypothetical protein
LFTAKQQVVVVDPKGDWWGLLFDRSGKGPGLPFIVLGGEHGHAPLQSGGGEIVGRLVVEQHVSLILDLSQFRKHEIATFMADFMETLYRLKASEKYRTPVMLVIDEADAIAPQRPQPNEARMLGAAEDLVRRGGQRGIGVTLITQRAAVLNKNVLTQIGVLIVLRTIAPQDRKAMDEWITAHGTPEQRAILLESLSSLPTGTAWVWSPGWPDADGIFQKVDMLLPETFDSSSTPKAFANRRQLANAAPVDLEALRERMADAIAHAKENDPGELKKAIAALRDEKLKLQRQLDSLRSETPAPQIEYVDKPVLTKKVLQRIEQTLSKAERVAAQLKAIGTQFDDLRLQVLGELQGVNEGLERTLAATTPLGAVQPAPGNNPLAAPTNSSGLPSGELAVLRAIAQHRGAGAAQADHYADDRLHAVDARRLHSAARETRPGAARGQPAVPDVAWGWRPSTAWRRCRPARPRSSTGGRICRPAKPNCSTSSRRRILEARRAAGSCKRRRTRSGRRSTRTCNGSIVAS